MVPGLDLDHKVVSASHQLIQPAAFGSPRFYRPGPKLCRRHIDNTTTSHLDSLSFQPRELLPVVSYLRTEYYITQLRLNHTAKMSATVARNELIALYRSFLRELPARGLRSSPIQLRIREAIQADKKTGIAKANEYLKYIKAQRMYATLLERYNPGMNMEEEERVKLTARRVGMELPLEYFKDGQKK